MHNSPLRQGISDRNDRFCYPFIHFNYWNPYPFLQYRPENGTPLGRSLPVWAITKRITLISDEYLAPPKVRLIPVSSPSFSFSVAYASLEWRGEAKRKRAVDCGKGKWRTEAPSIFKLNSFFASLPSRALFFNHFYTYFYIWTSQWEPLRRRKESISPCVCSGRAMSTQVWDNYISSFLQYSECPLRLA